MSLTLIDTEPYLRASARANAFGMLEEQGPSRLLIVDDEEGVRSPLARFLGARGYQVYTAATGEDALQLLAQMDFELLLCDVRMPGMSGLQVVPQALEHSPDLAILMLTAVNDALTATDALAHGAMDYLMKPIELADLERAVRRGLQKRALGIEQRAVEKLVREEVVLRTHELRERTAELERERETLRELTVRVAETLINAMEAKDIYLRGHSQRVAALGAQLAHELELDDDLVEDVRLAGRLHDVGKIGIREDVLNKAGSLTDEEFAHIKEHVRIGMGILEPLQHLGQVLTFVRDHHERWDGSGYPLGRQGEDISIGGRILYVADAFDALTSRRAYREAMTVEDTIALMETHDGRHTDPRVLAALKSLLTRREALVFIEETVD